MRYTKTRIVELRLPEAIKAGIQVLVKREDLNHPHVSGNKWWKLKYNLEEAVRQGKTTLLTFGGAYSNHLYATAAAAAEMKINSIGIVRGEETLPLNPTLTFARSKGMQLHYLTRQDYREKSGSSFVESLHERFGDFYLIPEGGTNDLAIKGVEELGHEIIKEVDFDYLCLPVGTGGTIAGLINVLHEKKIIGFSSLKGGEFLSDDIKKWLRTDRGNWTIEAEYHFGGYGKSNDLLLEFIKQVESEYSIPFDQVYTGKMMFGVVDLINKNRFQKGSRVLLLHTGGLQGRSF